MIVSVPTATSPNENITGCIEDRIVIDDLNILQLPGGDAFLTAARDIIAVADYNDEPERFVDSVLRDIELIDHYTLHRDEDHGDFYDGCGFLASQSDIYRYLADSVGLIIKRLNSADGETTDQSETERAHALARATGKLAVSSSYLSVCGGALVSQAAQAGVETISYRGDHTAGQLTINRRENETYDPIVANDDEPTTETSFNVDIDSSLHRKAAQFDITADDAVLLAKLLSVATVDVLSDSVAPLHIIS